MMLRFFYFSFFTSFFLSSLSAAKPVYKVGVEDIPYLPFYETRDGVFQGFARELLDEFARDHELEFEYVPLPVKRLYFEYLKKDSPLDFKFPDNEYWAKELKKEKTLSYSSGLATFIDGVLVSRKKSSVKIEDLKKLGVVRGFTAWDYLKDIKEKRIEKVENNSLESLLKLAMLDRVDGIYVNVDVADYLLKNKLNSEGELRFLSNLPHTKSSYTISSYKHSEVINKFNQWLKENVDKHNQILKKWNLTSQK